MWWMYALLSAFFAGLTAVLAKTGVKGIDADLATAVRTTVILVITWGVVVWKGGTAGIMILTGRNLLFLALSGLATGLSWLFYFRALQLGPVSRVAPVDKSSVVVAVLLSVVFLQETLTWKAALGCMLILAGTWLLIK